MSTLHPGLVCILLLAASVLAAMFAASRAERHRRGLTTRLVQAVELPHTQWQPVHNEPREPAAAPSTPPDTQVAAPTAPATSEVYLSSRCTCGAHQLQGNVLEQARVCLSCMRVVYTHRGRIAIVPVGSWRKYADWQRCGYGGAA